MKNRLYEFDCSICGKKFLSQKKIGQTRRCCSLICAGKLAGGENAIPLSERFFRYYQKKGQSDCWIWSGPIGSNGYGNLTENKKYFAAHRISWNLYRGPIPKGAFICHVCDNPLCVNPNHLFLGDPKINIEDANNKGHLNKPRIRLTKYQKLMIRSRKSSGHKTKDVAREFNISTRHVRETARWRKENHE